VFLENRNSRDNHLGFKFDIFYNTFMLNLKHHFLLDPAVTFLNHGSFGATPKPVYREYQRWQREMEKQPVEFLGRRITQLLANSRAELGKYLGTSGDNLVYTQNVTVSLNIVARSLELGTGDEVLTTNHEYGAIDRTWHFLSKERGFSYINQPVTTPLTTAEKFIEDVWQGVTPCTRVICLSHITSPTAIIFPIKEIIQRAREKGIITIIDGAHVAGQIPLHLDLLDADFYGGNLHNCQSLPERIDVVFGFRQMSIQPRLKRLWIIQQPFDPIPHDLFHEFQSKMRSMACHPNDLPFFQCKAAIIEIAIDGRPSRNRRA
jgi:selenocysteine lyase/cysteine desulfurase